MACNVSATMTIASLDLCSGVHTEINFDASVVQLLVCVWVVAFGTPRSRSDTTNGVCEDQCLLRQHVDTVVRLYKSSAKSLDPGGAAIPGWGSQKVPKQMRSHNRWSFG